MKIHQLQPRPMHKESFRRANQRFVSERAGCYVLATFEEDILYVGLASELRRRFGQHLDTVEKVEATPQGRAVWFFWHECNDLQVVERTWMNTYILQHGVLPVLNKVYSPTSV